MSENQTYQRNPNAFSPPTDGGGIRGISELLILEEIMNRMGRDPDTGQAIKPFQVFDVICGTSTGGLIAIMLGRLQMSVQQCIASYNELSETVFGMKKRRMGMFKDRYSATTLEDAIKKVVMHQGSAQYSDELMEDTRPNSCKVFVCAMPSRDVGDGQPHLFRTYSIRGTSPNVKIWEAARATTAAPTFFKAANVLMTGGITETFIDGGFGCNNPSMEMIKEFQYNFGLTINDFDCVVSIGTGASPRVELPPPNWWQGIVPTNLINVLRNISTSCENMHQFMLSHFDNRNDVYFRFNVTHGMSDIGLGEWKLIAEVRSHTSAYIRDRSILKNIETVANLLLSKRHDALEFSSVNASVHLAHHNMSEMRLGGQLPRNASVPNAPPRSRTEPMTMTNLRTLTDVQELPNPRRTSSTLRNWQCLSAIPTIPSTPMFEINGSLRQYSQRIELLEIEIQLVPTQPPTPMEIGAERELSMMAAVNADEGSSPMELEFDVFEAAAIKLLGLALIDRSITESSRSTRDIMRAKAALEEQQRRAQNYLDARKKQLQRATKEYQDRFLDLLQSRLPSRSLDNKGERCEGTANWIFEKPEFETWKETDQPRILTLLGPPGQGKLWKLLTTILADAEAPDSIFIVDGLDECTEDSQHLFLTALYRDFVNVESSDEARNLKGKFFLTSRDTATINEYCFKSHLIRTETDDVKNDIITYVRQEMEKFGHSGVDNDMLLFIATIITSMADGMFLWVSLVLGEVFRNDRRLTFKELTDSLNAVPGPLYGLYHKMMIKIPEDQQKIAFSMLETLLFACNPLTIEEFSMAILAPMPENIDHSKLLEMRISDATRAVKTIFGGLIRISNGFVQLCHHTAEQFFMKDTNETGIPMIFSFNAEKAHTRFATFYLQYLMLPDVHIPKQGQRVDNDQFPFLAEALSAWHVHVRKSGLNIGDYFPLLKQFLTSDRFFDCLRPYHHFDVLLSTEIVDRNQVIMYSICQFGLTSLLEYVKLGAMTNEGEPNDEKDSQLHLQADINMIDDEGNSLLMVAIESRSNDDSNKLQLIRKLIELGINANFTNKNKLKVLHVAAMEYIPDILLELLPLTSLIDDEDENGDTPLIFAAAYGHLQVIKALLAGGANVNHANSNGYTAIHVAADEGTIQGVRLLLSHGAEQKPASAAWTPLHFAASKGHGEIVDTLLNYQMSIDSKDDNGFTALHIAAEAGYEKIVEVLLRRGADKNAITLTGMTPIHSAVIEQKLECVKALLIAGASPDLPTYDDEETPLFMAASTGNVEIAKLLVEAGAKVNNVTADSRTPLRIAAVNGHLNMVEYLHEKGADMSFHSVGTIPTLLLAIYAERDNVAEYFLCKGCDPDIRYHHISTLYVAAWRNRPKVLESLLSRKVNIKVENEYKKTILHWLAEHNIPHLPKRCIKAGLNANVKTSTGLTPLHLAALHGHLEVIKILHANGAQIDHTDSHGYTPLLFALRRGHIDCVKYLIDKGANNAQCSKDNGLSTLHLAAELGSIEIFRLMDSGLTTKSTTNEWQPIHCAASSGHINIVEELLSLQADVNCRTINGSQPIHLAAGSARRAMIKRLLVAGATLDGVTNDGDTVLHYLTSCIHADSESVRILFKNGAQANSENNSMDIPLHYAAYLRNLDAVKILLDYGQSPNHVNNYGFTPLHYAATNHSVEIVKSMLEMGGNLQIMDGYGRSGAFWLRELDPDILNEFSIFLPETNEIHDEEWQSHLRNVAQLAHSRLIEEGNDNSHPDLIVLRQCLNYLGRKEEAMICYEHSINVVNGEYHHNAFCDFDHKTISGKRFTCLSCTNIDLCEEHHKVYHEQKLRIYGCIQHEFLQIPRDIYDGLEVGEATEGKTWNQWLQKLSI